MGSLRRRWSNRRLDQRLLIERSMTRGFRYMLRKAKREELSVVISNHLPRKAQQVLRKKDLKPIDLLDMTQMPNRFSHHLVYLDVPVRAGRKEHRNRPLSVHTQGKKVKILKLEAAIPARNHRSGKHASKDLRRIDRGGRRRAHLELQNSIMASWMLSIMNSTLAGAAPR